MQLADRYPLDTVTGGCFITGRYELEPGEHVIDLDRDLEALPAWGKLCLSEQAVKAINTLLGWNVDPRLQAKVTDQRREIKELRDKNRELRNALEAIGSALQVAGITLTNVEGAA